MEAWSIRSFLTAFHRVITLCDRELEPYPHVRARPQWPDPGLQLMSVGDRREGVCVGSSVDGGEDG